MARKNKKKEISKTNIFIKKICGVALIVFVIALCVSLITYNAHDTCINQKNNSEINNLLGAFGANLADLVLCSFGFAFILFSFSFLRWGYSLIRHNTVVEFKIRLFAFVLGIFSSSCAVYLINPLVWKNYPISGKVGQVGAGFMQTYISKYNIMYGAEILIAVLLLLSFMSLNLVFGITLKNWYKFFKAIFVAVWRIFVAIGKTLLTIVYMLKGGKKEKNKIRIEPKVKETKKSAKDEKIEPKVSALSVSKTKKTLSVDGYMYPDINLLSRPKDKGGNDISQKELDATALKLEEVLQEFGVNGKIVKVRPGPVVTLYELEPAPGTKTARVISLSDDIARSMSAVSVRIAVVPGSNTIGIELPNRKRETVWLKDLLSDPQFTDTKNTLNIVLGKDIGGKNTYADLAKMPHLLVAGTTGSGKSVGVNSMILSLLYRLSPEKCKFIMIDPKMLEFSMYNGIPHLLTPVITDPAKAVVGLKWAVREMESRNRKMALLNVKNITGYNQKLKELKESGEKLTKTIQVGFDAQTGKPIYEEQEIDTTELPYIVIVVDEMADLMLVAGKEVEAAIQRLAQMARAAGIHLIMATQRPSVDVVTGTIKANFPSRISFQVTSKIDSRTILGEQGAEQLLGMGDMLYMPAGLRPLRVHGGFVKESEIEAVVEFLKNQREPEYVEEVTAGDLNSKDTGSVFDNTSMGSDADSDLYMQALAIVRNDKKASTSYIQRKLRIGYNRAAALIDRMEEEGIVGPADHVGRREILN